MGLKLCRNRHSQEQEQEQLRAYTKENAPKLFTMNGQSKWCKVIDVYDGDTINIVFSMGGQIVHHKMRLAGIDTPEMKPLKTTPNRDAVIENAKKAKAYLESHILDKIVWIEFCSEEKYGRLMGVIYLDRQKVQSQSVNKMMIDNGHAKKYNGGKKE